MKYSGIEWIGEIPEDWDVRRVKNCFYLSKQKANQKNPTILRLARDGIQIRDISNNEGQLAANYEDYNPVLPGDLLLNPMDLYSGANCNVSEISGVISPAYANLRANLKLNAKYFDYYFKIQYWTMAMFAHGKGVSYDNRWTINNDTLLAYEIPFPQYKSQTEIVKFLNQKLEGLNNIIANQNAQIEKLKEYKQSVITEAVTKGLVPTASMKDSDVEWIGSIPLNWNINRLKYICSFNPPCEIDYHSHLEVSYAPMECVGNGTLEHREIAVEDIKSGLTCFTDEDIVMAKVTPCFENGNIAIAENLKNAIAFGSSELFVFRAHSVLTKFLFYFLRNIKFVEQAKATMTGTGGLKRVSPEFVRSLTLAIPPKQEQQKIADYLDKKCAEIDKLISIKQQKIEKLNKYKKSLIYEYVTGKKDVCSW